MERSPEFNNSKFTLSSRYLHSFRWWMFGHINLPFREIICVLHSQCTEEKKSIWFMESCLRFSRKMFWSPRVTLRSALKHTVALFLLCLRCFYTSLRHATQSEVFLTITSPHLPERRGSVQYRPMIIALHVCNNCLCNNYSLCNTTACVIRNWLLM